MPVTWPTPWVGYTTKSPAPNSSFTFFAGARLAAGFSGVATFSAAAGEAVFLAAAFGAGVFLAAAFGAAAYQNRAISVIIKVIRGTAVAVPCSLILRWNTANPLESR